MAHHQNEKTVGVIGAGQCGLVTTKILLECGFSVTTFEQNSDLGGLWNYELNNTNKELGFDSSIDNEHKPRPVSYSGLRMNTSVWSTVYSDFPPQEGNYDEFMTALQYLRYLKSYVDHFQLKRHITFEASVIKLFRSTTLSGTKWTVQYMMKCGELKAEQFDFVVVCTGAYHFQKIPEIAGLKSFRGGGNNVLESNRVRDPEKLCKGKTVLIVGGSVTGTDLACKALEKANKVYLSATSRPTERSRWFMSRYPDNGAGNRVPWDMRVNRHSYLLNKQQYYKTYSCFMELFLPRTSTDKAAESHITPTYGVDAWMVADAQELKDYIKSGNLKLVPVVSGITRTQVQLSDNTCLEDVDVIILATGFKRKFPFLDKIWSQKEQSKFELFNHIVPIPEELDGVFFTGLTHAPIGVFVVAEMQARWLGKELQIRTYDSQGLLYTTRERLAMAEDIELCKSRTPMAYNYIGDPYAYMDKLARHVGCVPKYLDKEFSKAILEASTWEEISLTVAVYYGPFIAAHYQLSSSNQQVQDLAKETTLKVARLYLGAKFKEYVDYYWKQSQKVNNVRIPEH